MSAIGSTRTIVGSSGRRYAVAVYELNRTSAQTDQPAILLAIARDGHGIAVIKDLALASRAGPDWTDRARSSGATELHVHLLSASDDPSVVLEDLWPESVAKARVKTRRAA